MTTLKKYIDDKCKDFINVLPFNHIEKSELPVTTEEDLVFIDQEPCNPFNLNEAGWIRNDISAFELAENEQIAAQVLQRFEEVQHDDIYKDMTDEEMFEACLPRRATTDPVSYQKYLLKLTEIQYRKEKERIDKLNKELEEKEKEREFSKKQLDEAKNQKSIVEAVENSSVASEKS